MLGPLLDLRERLVMAEGDGSVDDAVDAAISSSSTGTFALFLFLLLLLLWAKDLFSGRDFRAAAIHVQLNVSPRVLWFLCD